MTNHLGNVLSVISDRKLVLNNAWVADVQSYSDYYPFGMSLSKRNGGSEDYRFAFNGMERDNEVKGNGNHYTILFRQYDPRLARWITTDPVTFISESPYTENHDNPIYWSDPMGDCPECDENNSDPEVGDTYVTESGWEFTYTEKGWTGAGYELDDVEVTHVIQDYINKHSSLAQTWRDFGRGWGEFSNGSDEYMQVFAAELAIGVAPVVVALFAEVAAGVIIEIGPGVIAKEVAEEVASETLGIP